jgi:hypothetical protein
LIEIRAQDVDQTQGVEALLAFDEKNFGPKTAGPFDELRSRSGVQA